MLDWILAAIAVHSKLVTLIFLPFFVAFAFKYPVFCLRLLLALGLLAVAGLFWVLFSWGHHGSGWRY
jgi:hypothetical protein